MIYDFRAQRKWQQRKAAV